MVGFYYFFETIFKSVMIFWNFNRFFNINEICIFDDFLIFSNFSKNQKLGFRVEEFIIRVWGLRFGNLIFYGFRFAILNFLIIFMKKLGSRF